MRPRSRGSLRLTGAALACAVLLGSCSGATEPADPTGTADDVRRGAEDAAQGGQPGLERYVALGDSFTAAPLVPTTDLAEGCLRSDGNYPAIVAERLDIAELVDVSCSGARTRDLTRPQRTVRDTAVPPQLEVLDPDTDLVTLGIGGNDFGLFSTLVSTCAQLAPRDPQGTPCADDLASRGIDLVARTADISARVERAVEAIRERAPEAEVLLVGYLRIAPTEGRCRALPFARGDYAFGDRVTRALNAAIERAARRTGAGYVDMHAASEGHDVCAEDAWVNGHRTLEGEALAFHPFAEGMEAVADEVVSALE